MQDTIQREITIRAPKEKIYAAIADPHQIVAWFPDKVEGGFEVGDRPIISFGTDHKTQIYIVDAQPYEYFSYNWIPGGHNDFLGDVLSQPHTLVEFRITEEADTCIVTVTESGFTKLPQEVAEDSYKQNSGGWEHMMGRLEKYFAESQ